ncbi:F-box domain [Arabidopsis thaliana x Arabidopsis arenosa]|uniref:F-box domain n=1 Tax=Arabidopsis thaliana x Arabidopsis arenosa TaxID=1240361 RepID=A0A8T2B3H3_9BRAS|nr:F-box domain [Arabidopsis thaliana x Arabidopsis arenosa]
MYLPEELVVEILSRVPFISLARLRWTSKRWNAMIKDKILACHGLLLCGTKDNRLVVCNPLSCETTWIQPGKSYTTIDIFALGYNKKSSCYTILRMYRLHDSFQSRYKYEVYDFTSNSWRVVGVTTGWVIPPSQTRHGMSMKRNTYWLAEEHGRNFLLSFDYTSETFQCLSLPADANTLYHYLALSVTREEQQLCMLATDCTGALSWTKFLTVTRSGMYYRRYFGMTSFLIDQENKVVYCNSFFSNTIHIVGEDKYIEVNHDVAESPNESHNLFLLSYVPSFLKIQQGI